MEGIKLLHGAAPELTAVKQNIPPPTGLKKTYSNLAETAEYLLHYSEVSDVY
jgi:hypothetical protein